MTVTNDGEPLASEHGDTREPMAEVRPRAPAAAPLARARVLGALFGPQATVGAFGRFHVVDRLGAGGMGVVYEAYDPDLARGVALKLVDVTDKDRDTALAEAKALARLSHPNVVPIYDYGLERDHIYLVMELVRGETLRQWPHRRTLQDILAVYLQAGAALAAAHDVGLVHRDFKPDNAIVGADGRVRVVDFGLACEADALDRATSERRQAAGTPRFMAPEIKAGAAVTPAADQYSFCVALAEALQLVGSPPRRIAAILDRGRSAGPADRFPSMRELMRALARDPARTRRRVVALGALAGAVGVTSFLLGKSLPSGAPSCDDGDARIEAIWSAAERSSAFDRVAAASHDRSLRALLEGGIHSHVRRWVNEYQKACMARYHKAESDVMSYRRDTCLRRRSDELVVVKEQFRETGTDMLTRLPRAVQHMGDPTQCSDAKTLESDIEPPPPALAASVDRVQIQVTRARIEIGLGRHEQAFAHAGEAVSQARSLQYSPVLAEALIVQGHAGVSIDKAKAVPILGEAMTVAIQARADALAVEAWARRAYAMATATGPDGALAGLDMIEPLAARTASAAFARPLLYNNLGSVELARPDRARARGYFERALAESRKIPGTVPIELLAIRFNLALTTDDRLRADQLFAEEAQQLAARLGNDHPEVVQMRLTFQLARGLTTVDLRRAAEVLAPVCSELEQRTTLAWRAMDCWAEVGRLRWDLGDRAGASEAMQQAVRARSDAETAAYLALFRDDARGAAEQFEAALATSPPGPNDPWWDRYARARLHLGLGRARRAMDDLPGAREALEAALPMLAQVAHDYPTADYERRLGRARVELAFTLSALRASHAQVAGVARPARDWLQRVGGNPAEIAQLTTSIAGSAR